MKNKNYKITAVLNDDLRVARARRGVDFPTMVPDRASTAWYCALLLAFEACSAACTAKALAACPSFPASRRIRKRSSSSMINSRVLGPFVVAVACWELGGGVLCALPFWVVRARPAPDSRCVPCASFGAALALAFCAVGATFAADGRGVPAPASWDVAATLRALDGSRSDAAAAFFTWRDPANRAPARGASFVAGPLATMDRLGPRHCLASSRAALQSVGFLGGARVPPGRRERGSLFPRFRGTRRWPRPETWGGNAATMAAAVAASKVVALAADALVDDAGDVVASDGDTGEAREDPESALFFLVACAVAVGLCASHWIAACRAEALRVIDPPAPANVAACPHSPRPSFLLFL